MKKFILIASLAILLLAACEDTEQSTNPAWVDQLIEQFEKAPAGNPPLSIWQYEYKGETVYFVPAHCCDIASVVYDASGEVICSPDGGITGKGDGRCDDFFDQRSNEQLIWKDERKR